MVHLLYLGTHDLLHVDALTLYTTSFYLPNDPIKWTVYKAISVTIS